VNAFTHISARVPTADVEALAVLAKQRDRSFSAELRLAVADRVGRAQIDDDPAEQGEAASTTSPMQAASDAVSAA